MRKRDRQFTTKFLDGVLALQGKVNRGESLLVQNKGRCSDAPIGGSRDIDVFFKWLSDTSPGISSNRSVGFPVCPFAVVSFSGEESYCTVNKSPPFTPHGVS
jgi:hypothetical protein